MRSYSKYYRRMILVGLFFLGLAVLAMTQKASDLSVVALTIAFICLWVASMAPAHEKYKNHER